MMKNKIIYSCILLMLVAILVTSIFILYKNLKEEKVQQNEFEKLEEIIIEDEEKEEIKEDKKEIINNNNKIKEQEKVINLENLYSKNKDLVGWIKIKNTNINYPVMKNKDFYLRRNFSKQYSYYGTPFLADYCNIKSSDNLIIYGHNMKFGTMFADLIKYKNYNYYKNHKYIELYTLDNNETIKNDYKIIYCFKTTADSKGFNFYDYYKFDNQDELNVFKDNCKRLSFFNTNEDISLSDKLITLSTCEYSNKNGRMIVVAKKI